MRRRLTVPFLLLAALLPAQTVLPPFNAAYTAVDLGAVPGRASYGGLAFRHDDPDVLLYGEYDSRRIVAVPVMRDARGRITGFGTPAPFARVGGPDGGLAYGPGDVLFATVYGAHTLEQLRPGSASVDRTIDLTALGVPPSVGACAFPPPGHPGAGRLKILSFGASTWTDATLAPDGNGTFSITPIGDPLPLSGGPEGALYPPTGLPLLADHATVLVAEWNPGTIALYDTDALGNPLPASRRPFAGNLPSCGGGAVDPRTGDMLFSFGAGHVVAIRNVGSPCGSFTSYGAGTPGLHGVPVLGGQGCARLGQRIAFTVTGGRPGAPGVLNVGTWYANLPALGITVLTMPVVAADHVLDGNGAFALTLALPADPVVAANDFFLQALYLDAAAPQGLSATRGLRMDAN